MGLKAVVKSLDGLSDAIKELYKKQGDEYVLDVEGMVPKAALDEFRDTNIALKKERDELKTQLGDAQAKLKQYDGIDVDEVKKLREQDQKLKDKKLIEAGKIDELIESRLAPIKQHFEDQVAAEKKRNEELTGQLERLAIDDRLTKLAVERGVRPTAVEDLKRRGREIFKLKDGKVLPLNADGTTIYSSSGNPLMPEEWIEKLQIEAPHLFEPSKGGGAPPGKQASGGGNNGKTIPAGDPVAFGRHLESIAKGDVTVQRS